MTAADWARYSALLDEALDLGPEARAAWLAALLASDADAGAALAGLLQRAEVAQRALQKGSTAPPAFQQWVHEAAQAGDRRTHGQHFGPWRLLRPLGQGGMGEVWLAARKDGLYDGEAALKFIRSGLAAAQLADRFARERRVLARLHHPGIARLLDAGVDEGQPYTGESRAQFLSYVGKVLRCIVIDHLREQGALKRGGDCYLVTLSHAEQVEQPQGDCDLLKLDAVMAQLVALDAALYQTLEMNAFTGLSTAEIARTRGVSERTVQRDLVKARALVEQLMAG